MEVEHPPEGAGLFPSLYVAMIWQCIDISAPHQALPDGELITVRPDCSTVPVNTAEGALQVATDNATQSSHHFLMI